MIRSHKFDGYLKHLRNPDSPLTEVESAVVQSLIERRLEQIAKEHGRLRGGQPAEAIKKLRGDTTKIFTEAFPNFKNRRKQIADKYKPEFEKARARIASIIWDDLDLGFGGIANETVDHVTPPPPPLPAGIGEFWWDRTTFFSTLGEISVEQPDDEFIRIFGHLHWGGDSLLPGSVGFIQNFVLSPDRFPSTSETSFIIRSSLRNIGVISGFTGFYHPFWAADDKWCKCQWLVTARLFAPVGADSISQPAANTLHRAVSGTEVILNLDNESPVGQESKALPPIVGREVLFDRANLSTLSALGLSFVVQIENRFNIQLEGDADIWFTGNGGEPASRTPLVSRPHRSIWKPASLSLDRRP
jgi:hypothetical protein